MQYMPNQLSYYVGNTLLEEAKNNIVLCWYFLHLSLYLLIL